MKQWKSLLVWAAVAAPLGQLLPACTFPASDGQLPSFNQGPPPLGVILFCDVDVTRRCSTLEDREIGIDIARPNEDGFWIGRSSNIGLDYSPDALAECGGEPKSIVYLDKFPDGSPVCVSNAPYPGQYANNNERCKAWCASHGWIDGNGQLFDCASVAWHSNGSANPFLNGCTDAGTLLAAAADHDPRKIRPATIPVKWVERVGVDPNSSDLVKLQVNGFGNAGAVSNHELLSGDGSVQITASETNTTRVFGLGLGNSDAGFGDIEYGLSLTSATALAVVENGTFRGTFGTYATGDTLEVRVQAGVVRYLKNGQLLFQSPTPPTYPLHVDTALNTQGATIKSARTTF